MIELSPTWLTDGLIDFEYKQYIILDYLQKVEKEFESYRLYPYFSDLIFHYDNAKQLKNKESLTNTQFPSKLIGVDIDNFEMKYEILTEEEEFNDELELCLDFAIKSIKPSLMLGKTLFDKVKNDISIKHIGLELSDGTSGYFMIDIDRIHVYEYHMSNKNMKTKLVRVYPKDLGLTYQSIRLDLVESSNITLPSVYLVVSEYPYPLEETLLPVTKRLLIREISN